ncbi:hypothetical protein CR983_04105 [Candidatus Saccharibacteria bacterium]|nr:MAG: hypothetical protein CR983_04105 [Candidatus Saccharibacteria bacterium]
MKHPAKDVARRVVQDQENGSRKAIIEELFYDFNRSRVQIYKMNFIRGIMFGIGSALGGTVIVALLLWLLSIAAQSFTPATDFFTNVNDAVKNAARSSE